MRSLFLLADQAADEAPVDVEALRFDVHPAESCQRLATVGPASAELLRRGQVEHHPPERSLHPEFGVLTSSAREHHRMRIRPQHRAGVEAVLRPCGVLPAVIAP